MVRFLVSDIGISWVECRDGRELVKLEGSDAIQELQRITLQLQNTPVQQPEATAACPETRVRQKKVRAAA